MALENFVADSADVLCCIVSCILEEILKEKLTPSFKNQSRLRSFI